MRHSDPDPIDVHVGSRLRARRTMLGVSQTKIGGDLGITFQQIQKYEKGTNRISASRLQEIARLLKVAVAHFFEDAPDSPPTVIGRSADTTSTIVAFLSTTEGIRLNKAFGRIGDIKLRRHLVDLVKAIAGDDTSAREASAG